MSRLCSDHLHFLWCGPWFRGASWSTQSEGRKCWGMYIPAQRLMGTEVGKPQLPHLANALTPQLPARLCLHQPPGLASSPHVQLPTPSQPPLKSFLKKSPIHKSASQGLFLGAQLGFSSFLWLHGRTFPFFLPPFLFFLLLSFFLLFIAAPVAYEGSQTRGQIGGTAACLHHGHSNAGSEPPL